MVCHRASFAFPEKPERALFGSRKVREETVFVLLFRLYEKVTKKYTRGLRPSGLPENGSKLYTSVLWISFVAFRVWNSFQALNRCETQTFIKRRIGFCGKLKLQCGLDAASSRWKGIVHVIFVAVERENWCVPTENLVLKCSLLVYGKLKILLFSTRLFVPCGNCFMFPKKSNSHQTNPFYETHNLLSAQIELRLFINTPKSLRSKITPSHRFKILRAVWHKAAIFHKISW